jgi:hypothetical protein
MYNCSLITYNFYDVKFDEYNKTLNIDLSIIDEEDKNADTAEMIYRSELNGVFGLDEFDSKIINNKLIDLSAQMYQHKEFSEIMDKCAEKLLTDDNTMGLMMLFSYDYFYLAHPCICEYLSYGTINKQKINQLVENTQM